MRASEPGRGIQREASTGEASTGLRCLVAFVLKVDKFKPSDLGQLSFYVEALHRDVKKAHERPSIGVLLCATKDDEVVEYALARTTSPTLAAECPSVLPGSARITLRSSRQGRRPGCTLG